MRDQNRRNKYFFGLGTIGRDMFYAFESNTILYFLTNVLSLPMWVFAITSTLLSVLRIVDAVNDPITGLVIDNIRSPWGKFKPAILVGGVFSAVFFLMLFGDIGTGWTFIIAFAIAYILWDISFGINDIGYWTLMPALSHDQKQREKIGAFARICANIGLFTVMVGWQPVTAALGNTKQAWFLVALAVTVLFLLGLLFPLLGVKEDRSAQRKEEKTDLKQMWRALVGNDQLMWVTLSMALFMVGYVTTTSFATYYMQYVFGDINMYAVLAAVVGVAQIAALLIFPLFSRKFDRKQLYTAATVLVVLGYLVFLFAENSLVLIAVCALMLFVGQAFIQLLMLMFLADTIEYGQWKLGKRNESVTFSVQPFINKIGGALATGLVSIGVVISGIKTGDVAAETIDAAGKLVVKGAMFIIPLIFILVGYIIYLKKFKLDEKRYGEIVAELEARDELAKKS